MTHGVNDTSVFTKAISDTNVHHLPDTDTAGTEGYDVRGRDTALVKIVNNEDQDATVEIEGTTFDDAEADEADTAVGSKTVAAGGGTETFVTSDPWAYLTTKISFATAPTGSSSVKVVYETDARGD